jgi:hypothetical protein
VPLRQGGTIAILQMTDDFAEAAAAFREKSKPEFKCR